MVPYNAIGSPHSRCPYCGKYLNDDTLTVSYTSTQGSSTYKTETPPIEIEEKAQFDFVKKIGRLIDKKVWYNVWKPIRG